MKTIIGLILLCIVLFVATIFIVGKAGAEDGICDYEGQK